MTAIGWINSQGLFDTKYTFHQKRVSTTNNDKVKQQKKLRKGDLVRYKAKKLRHISIVISDKADNKGNYQIIHAFGTRKSDHDNDKKTDRIFTRKVIVTSNQTTKKLSKPYGYGRIRLWN